MIVSIFAKISDTKRFKQVLSNSTMDNMLAFCVDSDKVWSLIFSGSPSELAGRFHASWIPIPKEKSNNDIEKSFECVKELFDNYKDNHSVWYHLSLANLLLLNCYGEKKAEIVEKIKSIVDREIEKLRLDAITCVHNNSVLTKGAYIRGGSDKKSYYATFKEFFKNDTRKTPIQVIQERVEDSNREIARVAARILTNLADDNEVDYKKFFLLRFKHFQNGENLEETVSYIHSQSLDPKRCKELFDQNIISIILKLAFSSSS